jgi:hypothetical protein
MPPKASLVALGTVQAKTYELDNEITRTHLNQAQAFSETGSV